MEQLSVPFSKLRTFARGDTIPIGMARHLAGKYGVEIAETNAGDSGYSADVSALRMGIVGWDGNYESYLLAVKGAGGNDVKLKISSGDVVPLKALRASGATFTDDNLDIYSYDDGAQLAKVIVLDKLIRSVHKAITSDHVPSPVPVDGVDYTSIVKRNKERREAYLTAGAYREEHNINFDWS